MILSNQPDNKHTARMRKVKYIAGFILCFGLGYFSGTYIHPVFISPVILTSKTRLPQNDEKEQYNYHTYESESVIYADVSRDDGEERITLRHTKCYRIDENGKENPIGCPGPICVEPDEICDRAFMEIFVWFSESGEVIESEKIYAGSFPGRMEIVPVGDEKLIVVSGLNLGAHSSEMRIFRIKDNQIVPVCRKEIPPEEAIFDKCVFEGDYGPPSLIVDSKGVLGISESSRSSSEKGDIYSRHNYYENGGFITERGQFSKIPEFLPLDSQ